MEEGLLTLGVDTSTETRSVVLLRGGGLVYESAGGLREGGSASLLADVDRALKAAAFGLKDVGLFAAAVGPGSFTGLRSGLATIKGLALTTGKPAVGVPTLHAIAYGARPAVRVVAMLPAGRGEVFAQLLRVTGEGRVTELEEPAHMPPADLLEKYRGTGGGLKWAGGGAVKFRELIREGARAAGADFEEAPVGFEAGEGVWMLAGLGEALARNVAEIAVSRYSEGGVWGAEGLRAVYVRPSDAELKERCHAQN